jgi:hypothetical protein
MSCVILVFFFIPPFQVPALSADLLFKHNKPLQHAFWLIYRRMKAEEIYGTGKYICTSPASLSPFVRFFLIDPLLADVGNGAFEPGPYAQPIGAQAPYHQGYGATAAGP